MRAKKRSASSLFSRRIYSVYKCALESDRMMGILVTILNIFLKRQYYPRCWLKLVDVILEKGKGPKNSLKRVHKVDLDGKIVKTHILKEDIE